MSLIALLESSKQVALETRESIARQNAEEVAEFEEFGADLVSTLKKHGTPPQSSLLASALCVDARARERHARWKTSLNAHQALNLIAPSLAGRGA